MNRISRSPAYLSSGLSLGAALVAAAAMAVQSEPALLLCLVGVLALGAGLIVGLQPFVTVGALGLVGGVIAGGVAGAPPLAALVAVTAAILAWDLGGTAIVLGEQLGRDAPTARLELAHATGSAVVGVVSVAAGYAVFETATGGQPVSGVFGLVLAVLVLIIGLRTLEPAPG
jgi:hypothetical protein